MVTIDECTCFIKMVFMKHCCGARGRIEIGCFWEMAEKAGLWTPGKFDTAMSNALKQMCYVDTVEIDGEWAYSVFGLKSEYQEVMHYEA